MKVKFGYRFPVPHDVKKIEATIDGVTQQLDVARTLVGSRFNVETAEVDFENLASLDKDIPRDGLVLEFLMSEGAGTTLYDTSRMSPPNNGSIVGATWQQLATGKWVLSFDGADDKVTVPDSVSLDSITSEITILAWVWFRDPTAYDYQRVVCKSWSGWPPWTVWIYNNRCVFFNITSGNTSYYIVTSGTVKYRDWSYLACVFDGDLHVYIDLVKESKAVGVTGIDTNDLDVVIGNWGRGDRPFNGLIGLVAIYNRALTEDEISEIYDITRVYFGV
jgi:hypothetical protein